MCKYVCKWQQPPRAFLFPPGGKKATRLAIFFWWDGLFFSFPFLFFSFKTKKVCVKRMLFIDFFLLFFSLQTNNRTFFFFGCMYRVLCCMYMCTCLHHNTLFGPWCYYRKDKKVFFCWHNKYTRQHGKRTALDLSFPLSGIIFGGTIKKGLPCWEIQWKHFFPGNIKLMILTGALVLDEVVKHMTNKKYKE